jgi:hypothetical protein
MAAKGTVRVPCFRNDSPKPGAIDEQHRSRRAKAIKVDG